MISCLATSLSLAVFLSFFLYNNACYFSKYLLKNPSCEELLKISSLALPFVAVKSCIHGFYLKQKKMVQIKYTISKSLHYCIVIGILSHRRSPAAMTSGKPTQQSDQAKSSSSSDGERSSLRSLIFRLPFLSLNLKGPVIRR